MISSTRTLSPISLPATTYIVSVFEKPSWGTVLTAKDKQKAFDLANLSVMLVPRICVRATSC
ncbi:hypothetical protein MesoLj131c_45550 [Mesorhizobium sp. 131-3-5]|uniref:hypothetical protein n=1 Tax=Mesorhizobium sp. 131-3-5 TaxID=2744520 RepID=UPI00192821C8|nr:hypothetical protein [Mesorhizobium sp. 131-3-5]BCH10297.1 hypothetical protein MesoLj131c_45550 [Mesorhizobium sp. 131-3-5]